MAIVYQHRRRDNNKVFYVGIGNNVKRAYTFHSRNQLWNEETNYGCDNEIEFDVEILHENITIEEAVSWEIYLISLYGRRQNGDGYLTNMTLGGEGALGRHYISSESRSKILSSFVTFHNVDYNAYGVGCKCNVCGQTNINYFDYENKDICNACAGRLIVLKALFVRYWKDENRLYARLVTDNHNQRSELSYIPEKLTKDYIFYVWEKCNKTEQVRHIIMQDDQKKAVQEITRQQKPAKTNSELEIQIKINKIKAQRDKSLETIRRRNENLRIKAMVASYFH